MDQLGFAITWLWYVPLWIAIGAVAGVMSERRGIVVAAAAAFLVYAFSANHVLLVTAGGTESLLTWFPFGPSDLFVPFFYAAVAAAGGYAGYRFAEMRRL